MRALASLAASPPEIVGVSAHPANIAVARNAGITATDSAFVAFVEDDQQLDPGRLEAVALAARTGQRK
jgi:succinoglycan biosynthesis protein ExoM